MLSRQFVSSNPQKQGVEDGENALSDEIGQHGEKLQQAMVQSGLWSVQQAEKDFAWVWTLLRAAWTSLAQRVLAKAPSLLVAGKQQSKVQTSYPYQGTPRT